MCDRLRDSIRNCCAINLNMTQLLEFEILLLADHILADGWIRPPCKIGDEAWIIRNYKGKPTPQKGIVSDISFTDDMELAIAVKHIGRGRWGVNIFPTYEEAEKALKGGVQE